VILDLLGEIGGVLEVISSVLGIILLPISKFSFYIKAMSKLYIARTDDTTLMLQKSNLKENTNTNKQKKL